MGTQHVANVVLADAEVALPTGVGGIGGGRALQVAVRGAEQTHRLPQAAVGEDFVGQEHGHVDEVSVRVRLRNQTRQRNEQHVQFPEVGQHLFVGDRVRPLGQMGLEFHHQRRIRRRDACATFLQMRRHEAVEASQFGMVAGGEQAQSLQSPPHGHPRIGFVGSEPSQLRMTVSDERLEPQPRHAVGRQQGGKLQRGAGGGVEQGERGFKDDGELFLLVEHLLPHVGMAAQLVHTRQSFGPQAGQISGRRDLGVEAEIDGDLLDGEREAAEFADNLARGGFLGGGGEALIRLVVTHEGEGVLHGERVHGDVGEGFAGGVEPRGVEAGGGDDAQPVGARQRGQLRGGEQAVLGDVVKDEQRSGPVGRIHGVFGNASELSGFFPFLAPLEFGLLRAAFQLRQHGAAEQGGVVALGVGGTVAEFGRVGQLADERQQFLLVLRAEHPKAGGVMVGKPVGVGDSQLGLALPAEAVDGGDEADSAGGELLVESAQFLAAADEEGILPAEIAGHALGAARALDAFPEAFAELGHAFADVLVLKGGGAFGKPRPDVGEVAVRDGGEPAGVVVFAAAGHLNEINGGNAVGAHELVNLPAQILVPFPAAILAAEVIGREADE